jgi:membrane protease subunit (stomatin/prohibitin family)
MGLAWAREVMAWTIVPGAVAAALILAPIAIATPSSADGAGAFVGGIMAGRVMNNMNRRTQAEEYQAYHQQPVPQTAPASQSAESRIAQLDKLAAGGYITPAEYKAKKQAILDGL